MSNILTNRPGQTMRARQSRQSSQILGGLLGFVCVAIFSVYAFIFSGDAMASRNLAPAPVQVVMPTAQELAALERRLAKATRTNRAAKTCMRGQVLGGTEIHIAMNFAPLDRPATKQNPGLARAHAHSVNGTRKVLVLESKDPTVWEVSGQPSAIVLLGKAVIGDHPKGTPIFAPRYASGCQNKSWAKLPKGWDLPVHQSVLDSLMDNLSSRFTRRAETVSAQMFNRPYASWRVARGEDVMTF